jgi:hypothetical protein
MLVKITLLISEAAAKVEIIIIQMKGNLEVIQHTVAPEHLLQQQVAAKADTMLAEPQFRE